MPSLPPAVIDVILPVLDEAPALPWVLTRMPAGARPIVVDNGSRDGSAAIARAHGALDGDADLVLGARVSQPGAWPVHARVANRLLARELRRRSGAPLTDLGPMRAARRAALLDLGIADRRFGWPLEMVLRAAAAGWRIDEVAVTYRPRVGRSKVTGTVRGTARAVSDMARAQA